MLIRNLADTFVDNITPAIYQYNKEPNQRSYEWLVSACSECLSVYSKVIDNIEEEYKHLNNQIDIEQATDSILKRLDQITTVLNEFNGLNYHIGDGGNSFIPITLKLEVEIKSMENQGNNSSAKLTRYKKELESLKSIIANREADILIPKIHQLNNEAKLLRNHIRNSGVQVQNGEVNATPATENITLPYQVEAVEEKPGTSKRVTFNEQANQTKEIKPSKEEFIDYFKSQKPEEAIPELLESVNGLKKSPHKSIGKEIKLREDLIKMKTKEIQNKHKNIQYGKYFTIAAVLSTLIIATAFLTQTYIILAALVIPAMIGLYGYNECQKPNSNLQENIEVTKSTVTGIEAEA